MFWVLKGVLHPSEGVADPSSPVVLFKRSRKVGIGYLLLYGPGVLELAVRVLGHGLAYWALCATPPQLRVTACTGPEPARVIKVRYEPICRAAPVSGSLVHTPVG